MSGNAGWGGPGAPGGYGPGGNGPGMPPGPGGYGGPGGYRGPGGYGGPGGPGGYGGPGWGYVPRAPKPGVIPLHPLSVSEIIGGVFGTLKRYIKPIYVPLLIVGGFFAVLAAVLGAVAYGSVHTIVNDARDVPDYTPTDSQTAEIFTFGGLAVLLLILTFFTCYVISSTICTTVLRHAVLGQPVTVRQAWNESRPHLGRVALDYFLIIAAIFLSMIVVMAISLGIGFATKSGVAATLIFLLIFPVLGFGTYLQVRLVLVAPVLVLENEKPIAALRRAWRLNEGAWWRSFGIPYLINLIGSFAAQIVLAPFVVVGMVLMIGSVPTFPANDDGSFPVGPFIVFYLFMWVGLAIANLLILPLTPLANGLLYMDRRIRRESLDVALAAQVGVDLQRGGPPPPYAQQPVPPAPPAPPMPPTPPVPPTAPAPSAPPVPPVPPVPPEDAPPLDGTPGGATPDEKQP